MSMRHRLALIIALVAAVLLLSAAVGMASARRADALTGEAVTITSAVVDPKTGVIRIEGTLSCSEEVEGDYIGLDPIVVSQRQGNRVVSAYDEASGAFCSGQPREFGVTMAAFDPQTSERLRFHPGRATVSGEVHLVRSSGSSIMPLDPIEVRLEPSRLYR
jgi:hypothetical protein